MPSYFSNSSLWSQSDIFETQFGSFYKITNLTLYPLMFPCVCVCVCVLSHFNPVWIFATPWTVARQATGKHPGMGCHTLLQGIFPTQGSNSGLPHCKRIIYLLSHRDLTHIPCIARWILNHWTIREDSKMILLAFLFIFFSFLALIGFMSTPFDIYLIIFF